MTTDIDSEIDLEKVVSKKALWDLCERLRAENDWCNEVFHALYDMGIREDPHALLRTRRFPVGTVRAQVTTLSDHFVYAKTDDNQWRMDRLETYSIRATNRATYARYVSDLHVAQNTTFEIYTPDTPEVEEETPSTNPDDYVSKDIVRQVAEKHLHQNLARDADVVQAGLATIGVEITPRLRAADLPVHAGVLTRKSGGHFNIALKVDEGTWVYNTTRDYLTDLDQDQRPTREILSDEEVDELGYLFVLYNPDSAPENGVWE